MMVLISDGNRYRYKKVLERKKVFYPKLRTVLPNLFKLSGNTDIYEL